MFNWLCREGSCCRRQEQARRLRSARTVLRPACASALRQCASVGKNHSNLDDWLKIRNFWVIRCLSAEFNQPINQHPGNRSRSAPVGLCRLPSDWQGFAVAEAATICQLWARFSASVHVPGQSGTTQLGHKSSPASLRIPQRDFSMIEDCISPIENSRVGPRENEK